MKILCYKENLLKGINSVVKGVPNKTTMPILEGILIQTNDKEIKLTTYDLEIGIEYVIECDIREQGNTVVNAIMFSEIIRKLPDSEISITLNDKNFLVIECEGALYKLSTMDPNDFPELPKIEIENSIEIEQNLLKNMIRKTLFAVSLDKSKPIYTGGLFEVENNKLTVVGVDGFRLALKTTFLDTNNKNFKAIIPGKTLSELNKILTESMEIVKIGISKNQAVFNLENCKIVTRILEGDFLNYKSVIPEKWETRAKINKNNIQDSFERINLISNSAAEKKFPVKVQIDIGKIIISCNNQTGDAKEEVFCETEGKNLSVGFNSKYILDTLKSIDEEEVYLEFGTNISPCLIKSTENKDFVYMVLPIRLKE